MNKRKTLIAGGDSFTFGHELSDDQLGKVPSKKTWSFELYKTLFTTGDYVCTASAGYGNAAIARTVFNELHKYKSRDLLVVVMWTFTSRYDWAMPRHKLLKDSRWVAISPWDTDAGQTEAYKVLQGSQIQQQIWAERSRQSLETGVKPFAESIYRYAANDYHETYLSWKSILWLQNIVEKKKIPYMFTLSDNSLFYKEMAHKKDQDTFLESLHKEINLENWYTFGERSMGFNQWAYLNEYERGTTHPLDKAHQDAVKLMKPKFLKTIGGK